MQDTINKKERVCLWSVFSPTNLTSKLLKRQPQANPLSNFIFLQFAVKGSKGNAK